MSSNLIPKIEYKENLFSSLKSLSISNNKITEWMSINELRLFPALEALRVNQNAVFGNLSPSVSRTLIIGRIGKLVMLNGSDVLLLDARSTLLGQATRQTRSREILS